MEEKNTFNSLKVLYFFLDENFEDLFSKCTDDDQRQQLRHDYVIVRDGFYQARNLVFDDNDPVVNSLSKRLTDSQKEMQSMLKNLKNIAQILDLVTNSVNLASRLIVLGA
jgi:hypothetical protein